MSTTHCDSSLSLNWNRNYSATITTSIILAVLSPITVAGNLLVTLSIWRNDSLRSPSYFFLAVLSAENFVCGLIYQPSYAAKELMSVLEQSRLTDSSLLFYTHSVVGGIGTYTTSIIILTITVIAIERWLYMTRRRWMNSTRVWKLLVVLLILPVPITMYRTLYILREGFCHSANMLAFICLLLFCFLTTTLTYLQVFRIIRRHQLRVIKWVFWTWHLGKAAQGSLLSTWQNTGNPFSLSSWCWLCFTCAISRLFWILFSFYCGKCHRNWLPPSEYRPC